jgi:glycosyltransferase involved in cell wall biosynthesis
MDHQYYRPQLTVAIPTYQRLCWLRQSLPRILEQVNTRPIGEVEVVVSDNASTDGSWEYLQIEASRNPILRINRNENNLGAEGNCYLLPSISRGRWLWIVGDDDFLLPTAIETITHILLTDPDFIAVNFAKSDEEMVSQKGDRCWQLAADLKTKTLNDIMKVVPHFAFGFISGWVCRREMFNVVNQDIYKRFERWGLSFMVDRYVAFQRYGRGVILAEVKMVTRKAPLQETLNYRADFDYFEWFFEGSTRLLDYLYFEGVISGKKVLGYKAVMLSSIAWKRILFERALRIIDRPRVGSILWRGYRSNWQYWLLCLPALYLPGLGAITRWLRPIAKVLDK